MVHVLVSATSVDYVNDEDDAFVDDFHWSMERRRLDDETCPIEFVNDEHETVGLTVTVHRHYPHNCCSIFLSKLFLSCIDDFETKFSLESMSNSKRVPIDHDLERSNIDSCRNVSLIP